MSTVKNQLKEFVISRTFDAPLNEVWEAFVYPERMKHWWGPKGFTMRMSSMDLRPGGMYHYCLRTPQGKDMWGKFIYREIVPLEKLVLVDSFSDDKGGITRHPFAPNWPLEMLTTFTFALKAGRTTFTVEWVPLDPTPAECEAFESGFASMTQGWTGTLERLEQYLRNVPVVVERILDAPVGKVWDAITDKDQMKKWSFDLGNFKAQKGLEFQFLAGTPEKEYLHLCRVYEVIVGKKLSYSWRYSGYEGDSLVTFELSDESGRTRLRLTHEGLGTFPAGNPDFAKRNFVDGWTSLIGTSLKHFVEK
jgi:uncharacterized protein YndB with AHSA1/START domain